MSSIREYFAAKTVLVTGATGFLGKALVEKILRGLPGLRRLYLLIRPRERVNRTVSVEERFRDELLRSSIFDRLRRDLGVHFDEHVHEKVAVIPGDLNDERFGLSDDDFRRLNDEVQVLINSAAVVSFDERLDLSLTLNTFGARRMLDFARGCRRLEAVLHISTCYVSGMAKGWVAEEVPPVPFDADAEADRLAEACVAIKRQHDGRPDVIKEELVKLGLREARARGWHDTYTFTKALGEQLLVKHRGDLPAVIVRPSIIESTLAEPEPGWIDGFRMGDPLFVGYGKGYLQDFPARPDAIMDLIPCDHVVNAILAAAPPCAAGQGFKVYQVASGEENPAPFRIFYETGRDYFRRNPMYERGGKAIAAPVWSFPGVAKYRRRLFWKYRAPLGLALAGLRPLTFLRSVSKLRKRLTVRRASLDLLSYYVDIYSPYVNIESRYVTGNTARLWASLSPEDRRLFNFDVRGIDWRDYIGNVHIPGLKRHVLNLSEGGPADGNGRALPAAPKAPPPDEDPEHEPPLHVLPEQVADGEAETDGAEPAGQKEAVPWGRVLAKTHLDDHRWLEAGPVKRLARAVTRRLMRAYAWLWHGFEAKGAEHLPDGPFIVAANHSSHLDTGAVMLACGRRGGELFVMGARDYFFNRRLRGWFFHTFLNVIPFDRTEAMIKGLRLARTVLRSGKPVLIFPEGTRSKNGALLPFKPGIGLLGLELGVPIVPCHIEGTFASMPKGKVLPRRRKVRVTFAPPVLMGPYRDRHPAVDRKVLYREVADDVRAALLKMQQGEG